MSELVVNFRHAMTRMRADFESVEIRLIRAISGLHRGKSVLYVRHSAIIFAKTPEKAIAQAAEQGLVGEWEVPEALEVPPPIGYRIIYDPQNG